jgi:hypothetical protein
MVEMQSIVMVDLDKGGELRKVLVFHSHIYDQKPGREILFYS